MTAELDYAFLADYAKAQDGRITAIDASFTQLAAPQFPFSTTFSVAGRIRRKNSDDDNPEVRIVITPPGGTSLETNFILTSSDEAVTYDNKVANVFAVTAPLFIERSGLCEVNIYLNSEHCRRLAFDVLGID